VHAMWAQPSTTDTVQLAPSWPLQTVAEVWSVQLTCAQPLGNWAAEQDVPFTPFTPFVPFVPLQILVAGWSAQVMVAQPNAATTEQLWPSQTLPDVPSVQLMVEQPSVPVATEHDDPARPFMPFAPLTPFAPVAPSQTRAGGEPGQLIVAQPSSEPTEHDWPGAPSQIVAEVPSEQWSWAHPLAWLSTLHEVPAAPVRPVEPVAPVDPVRPVEPLHTVWVSEPQVMATQPIGRLSTVHGVAVWVGGQMSALVPSGQEMCAQPASVSTTVHEVVPPTWLPLLQAASTSAITVQKMRILPSSSNRASKSIAPVGRGRATTCES
jgi:hypothetical protein